MDEKNTIDLQDKIDEIEKIDSIEELKKRASDIDKEISANTEEGTKTIKQIREIAREKISKIEKEVEVENNELRKLRSTIYDRITMLKNKNRSSDWDKVEKAREEYYNLLKGYKNNYGNLDMKGNRIDKKSDIIVDWSDLVDLIDDIFSENA